MQPSINVFRVVERNDSKQKVLYWIGVIWLGLKEKEEEMIKYFVSNDNYKIEKRS